MAVLPGGRKGSYPHSPLTRHRTRTGTSSHLRKRPPNPLAAPRSRATPPRALSHQHTGNSRHAANQPPSRATRTGRDAAEPRGAEPGKEPRARRASSHVRHTSVVRPSPTGAARCVTCSTSPDRQVIEPLGAGPRRQPTAIPWAVPLAGVLTASASVTPQPQSTEREPTRYSGANGGATPSRPAFTAQWLTDRPARESVTPQLQREARRGPVTGPAAIPETGEHVATVYHQRQYQSAS